MKTTTILYGYKRVSSTCEFYSYEFLSRENIEDKEHQISVRRKFIAIGKITIILYGVNTGQGIQHKNLSKGNAHHEHQSTAHCTSARKKLTFFTSEK